MPLLGVAVLAATFSLHVGQTRVLPHVHPGDVIVCAGASDKIRWKATNHGLRTSAWLWDKRLGLDITPGAHGRVTASCNRR